ncbi:unnamed protein product [Adineta ricciae]|uniref:5'-nucleotidase n=1 Tax=Adineta ricciae TaxID=249248 RepID=A0A814KML2_ADIRI|nr:unnamed protein product [Adineta ricciae]CAF1115756.1 unnamed protein product [Adineta ricciae]
MTTAFTILENKENPSRKNYILFLLLIIFILLISTITFAILLFKNSSSSRVASRYVADNDDIDNPSSLSNNENYVQWTILQMNDVYELLPSGGGNKGGLAHVAYLRDSLLKENPHTYTVLSGDFLSPSPLSLAIVNGTRLNGKQMIASFNTLGLDFVTFGNHEFDLSEIELIRRMNESTFTWISSNVFDPHTNTSFASSIPYKLITIRHVRILLIGLTTAKNPVNYTRVVNETSLVPFVQQFLQSLTTVHYDVLIALTHLDVANDIILAQNIPQIDLILGGHEHENYFLLRGAKFTPIYKADSNAVTVFIHRCAFNLKAKKFHVHSKLTKITSEMKYQEKTFEITNYWFNLGMQSFIEMGYQPNETVSCLPNSIELDGRSSSVRNYPTRLTEYCCQALLESTKQDTTVVALFNSGSIRIDDILQGKITQYDILRTLPFFNKLVTLSVPGQILAKVLSEGVSLRGNGMFLAYEGIATFDEGKTWLLNGTDISKSKENYNIVTLDYARENTGLNDPAVTIIHNYDLLHTKALLNYLRMIYPPC